MWGLGFGVSGLGLIVSADLKWAAGYEKITEPSGRRRRRVWGLESRMWGLGIGVSILGLK